MNRAIRSQSFSGFIVILHAGASRNAHPVPKRPGTGWPAPTQVSARRCSGAASPATIALQQNRQAPVLRQMRELTRIAEHEMHEVILSCKRARRDMLVFAAGKKANSSLTDVDRRTPEERKAANKIIS